jgi:hypothetical protein
MTSPGNPAMLVPKTVTMRLPLLMVMLGFPAAVHAEEPVVRSLTVPPELAAVTSNPEPSGIVWSPSLRRYLVVTDDAGLREKGTYHEPALLGLGEDGVLDKTPIPIRGIKAINDPESICAGPDGTFFLVTSHSPNRDNKTAADRRLLLQLKEDKGALKVLARLDLTKIDGGSLFALAGLPTDGRLDVEGVTYHGGALFIGFKSPLAAGGQAVIVRMANPLDALRAGKLRGKNVERFAAVSLCVPAKDGQVCQGISDLTFLPDGSLVVSANAPKGGPKDHGGALWHLAAPVGKAAPVLLQRFPHLKPEGVTLSPDGRSLVVVFDRGQETPQWTRLPLPGTPPH